MSLFTGAGPLPRHLYVKVQPNALGEHDWLDAVWFGLVSHPGRSWGCHVLLECGAVYRNVPLHQLAHKETDTEWAPNQAQTWDCYGSQFSLLEYPFLTSMSAKARLQDASEVLGQYVFTAIPMNDGFSATPEQAKEFYFLALENGRFTAQPTNHVLIEDRSFVGDLEWPKFLRRQTTIYSAEE